MQILGERVLHEQTWTLLKEKSYRDTAGKRGRWTYIERREQREAAVIVATTAQSGSLVLIEQFRVPFEAEIVEFPAGLIDPGETPEQTARRELAEETGYTGEVIHVGPGVSTTAGLSTEIIHMVYMRVEERPTVALRHEGSERIRVFAVRPEDFGSRLSEWKRSGRILDAKLYTYLKDHLEGDPL
ncbi:MAG: NUDIX hydrolase [Spirochaetaceae bacterium]|nr:MAG: NUDIX hydrolase [Spirochaetaceae bacterium]